jgi:probable HAF family extracellular repeat protein
VLFLGYIDLPAGGQPTYLISPASADTTVFAYAINDSGQITGVYQPNSTIRAFLQQNGVILNLGTFGGSQSTGYAVSPNGLAVGNANTATNAQHAYLTDNGDPIQDLGTLGGAVSHAFGVNSAGQVVGYSWITVGSSTRRAFLYTGGTMQNLGTLSGGTNSTAYGINEAGDVVGESSTSTPNGIFNHAFLYAGRGNDRPRHVGWKCLNCVGYQ